LPPSCAIGGALSTSSVTSIPIPSIQHCLRSKILFTPL
jgi:hypothetical protein